MESCSTMQEKWQQIANDITSGDTTSFSDNGSLVVVGSGIMCVSQFTFEALSHIKEADKVFYLVSDPATEVYIQELKPDATDLFVLYGEDKDRHETYAQITEVLLHYTRRGYKVVAVFYGHPGYLVNPAREAIKIARSEGLSANELPGISSLDTMISDLGFEPGIPGLQVFEATDLLMYSRELLPDCHVVINQVGCVGDVTFHFNGFPNPHFPVLIEYLIGFYGNDHVGYHYIGSQFPVCKSLVQRFKLADLLMPENVVNIQSMSTMYLPPLREGVVDLEMAKKIGMVTATKDKSPSTESSEKAKEQDAVKTSSLLKDVRAENLNPGSRSFSGWSVPQHYKPAEKSPLTTFLMHVSQSPELLREFQTEKSLPRLPEYQAKALRTRDSGWIRFSMENDQANAKKVIMKAALGEISGASEALKQDDGSSTNKPTTDAAKESDSEIVGADMVSLDSDGLYQVDAAPVTAKPSISTPRRAGASIAGSDKVLEEPDGLHQVDGAPTTAKPTIIAPRKAGAVIAGTERVLEEPNGIHQIDGAPTTAKPTIIAPRKAGAVIAGTERVLEEPDGLHQVDGAPTTAKPIIVAPRTAGAVIAGTERVLEEPDGLHQVDGAPTTAKPTIIAPRKAGAVIAGTERVLEEPDGIHQVDGAPTTAKPTIIAPRKAGAVIAGSDKVLEETDGLHQVDGAPTTAKPTIIAPRKAGAVIAGSDKVLEETDGLHQVDGAPTTAKPTIIAPRKAGAVIAGSDKVLEETDGLHQVDGAPTTAKPIIIAPRKAGAVIAGSDKVLEETDGIHQVDGAPITAKPTIIAPRKAGAVIAGTDRVS